MNAEGKQSLADFVFENKDKMPDNVYKILMEQYAKKEHQKGFVEVVYLYPRIIEYRDLEHKLDYVKRIAIVKKYDERWIGSEEIKVGLVDYGRICKNAYCPNDKNNEICICDEGHMKLIKKEDADENSGRVSGDDVYAFNLICDEVFVVSVKDI